MKNKTIKILVIALLLAPQVTFAVWWNPFTWGVFNKTQQIKEQKNIIIPSGPATPQKIPITKVKRSAPVKTEADQLFEKMLKESKVATPAKKTKTMDQIWEESKQNQQPRKDNQTSEIEKLKKEVEELKRQQSATQATIRETAQKPELDLASIVKTWRPRIARIECKWYADNNILLRDAFGSGVLIPQASDGNYVVITNKHVIRDENGYLALSCVIAFPDSNDTYSLSADLVNNHFEELSFDFNSDYGNIIVNNLTPYRKLVAGTLGKSDYRACPTKASVGDQVVILGYPGIGSGTDITATEGIISGYENGYYVTSAKVEHGNSGGAAILVKNNCYLGIPTYTVSGAAESLARVLDLNHLHEVWSRR